jgi:hypothetical protein
MRPDELRRLLTRRPFHPFRLYVSDGAVYDITHPEIASVTPAGVLVWLSPAGRLDSPLERLAVISIIHITRVEVYYPAGTSPS